MANLGKALGEPLATELADFCAANYKAQELEVIREAVQAHLDERLKEPKIRERFDAARQRRLRGEKKIAVITRERAC
jgi:hypothetical protein